MNDVAHPVAAGAAVAGAPAPSLSRHTGEAARRRLRRRYAAERRFKLYGMAALIFAVMSLGVLLWTVVGNGYTAFWQTQLRIPVTFDPATIAPPGTTDRAALMGADYRTLLLDAIGARFPEVRDRAGLRELEGLVGSGAEVQLRDMVVRDPSLIGQTREVWLLAHSDIDMLVKGQTRIGDGARVTERQAGWLAALARQRAVEEHFNWRFFTAADSRDPELVGVLGGVAGSAITLLICFLLAFPLGVMAAVYLEEYAPKNTFTDIIEVNINNLAAVPSIVFGLLGLAVFINFFGMPRSVPLVGGCVLALMSLPTIIIAARAALRAVPPSIREGALGIGASKMQMIAHHVLPLAMPGVLTGTIIAMAHALGETAPLLMIGMVAFITDIPTSPLEASTVLPVQIFMWADHPERGFVEKTSAAIIVLLVFMLVMNATAVLLRRKFERRW